MNKKISFIMFLIVSAVMLASAALAASVYITPDPAADNDNLVCHVTGGCYGIHTSRWYRNNNFYSEMITTGAFSVNAAATYAGDTWKCTAHDYCTGNPLGQASVIIRPIPPPNTPPTITSIDVMPNPVAIDGTLFCDVNTYDADGNAVTVGYTWATTGSYVLSSFVTDTLNLALVTGEAGGDIITCSATPYDGQAYGATVSDSADVSAINSVPVISPNIPDIYLMENSGFNDNVVDLWVYVTDNTPDDQLTYQIVDETDTTVVNCNIDTSQYVDCIVQPNKVGYSDVRIRVTDPEGLFAEDVFRVTVSLVNDQPPVISNIPPVNMLEDTVDTSLVLNDYVDDPDTLDSELVWTYSDNVNINVAIDPATSVVTLTPAPNWYGTEAIMFTVCDPEGMCDSDVSVVTVAPLNDAPIVSDIPNIDMDEDTFATLSLNDYVSDIDNTDAQITWTVAGNVNINVFIDPATNIAILTPAANWNGAETLTFTARDPAGLTDSDDSIVTVQPVNDCPTVTGILDVVTDEDTPLTTAWSLDDYVTDIDGDTITWTASGNVNIGVAIGAGNVVTFTPIADWNGAESITFTASDSVCSASDNMVTTVTPVNDAPIISDIPDVGMDEDTIDSSLDLDDYVSDIDNLDSQLVWTVSGNSNIAITIDPTSHVAVLMPALNWNGFETVTFTVCDPDGLCDTDTATITVMPVNDCPVVSDIPGVVMDEDVPYTTLWSLDDYVTDVDGDTITWSANGNVNIGVAIDAANVVTFTPAADWYGAEAITFTASDSLCSTSDNMITTVTPVNDAPIISDIPDVSMDEDAIDSSLDLDDYVSDIDNLDSELLWTVSGNSNIMITIDPTSHVAVLMPILNWNGAETVTFTVCDPDGLCDTDTATITVAPLNDCPVVSDIPGVVMYEDVPYTTLWSLDDYVTDVDGDTITWTANGNVNIGVAIGAGNVVTFTPATDWNGAEAITFTASDSLCSASDNLVVTVNPVNDAPVISDVPDIPMNEDSFAVLDLDNYASDVDNADSELSWTVSGNVNINIMIDPATNVAVFMPAADWNGFETVTFTVCDPDGLCDTDTVTITVTPVNDCPTVSNIPNVIMDEDVPYTTLWSLDDYVTDVDGDTITWSANGNVNIGVAISAGNVVTFTPIADWNGAESITFTASDSVCSASDNMVTTVTPVNDAPIISDIPDVGMDEDAIDSSLDLDDYVSDIDNLDSELSWTVSGNSNIMITIDPTSHVAVLMPILNWNGFETVTFTVCDPDGLCDTDTATITVAPVNDCPVVSDIPGVVMDEDVPYTTLWSLDDYVTDVDGDTITWTASGNVNIGVAIGAGDVVTFTPAANWNGAEAITFTASDSLCSASDNSIVTVLPVNDAPVMSDIPSMTMEEDTTRSIYLDNYVVDIDNPNTELAWSFSGNANINVLIDQLSHIATFTPAADWNGIETITFTICDPDGLCDSGPLTITVTPVNDAPIVSDIPDVIMDEDVPYTTLWSLDDFVNDVDNLDSEMIWSVSGNVNIGYTINPATRTVTFTSALDWYGVETLTFTACDPSGLCDSDVAAVVVNPVNDAPVISDVPDIPMNEDSFAVLDLDNYASDVDNADSELSWTVAGNVNINIMIDPATNVAVIMPALNWNGFETVTFTVCDPSGLCDTDTATITVAPVNDCPVMAAIPDVVMDEDVPYTTLWSLDNYATDIDGDTITWTANGNVNIGVAIDAANVVTFTPAADWYGAEAITFTASDSLCSASDNMITTVLPINDAPVAGDIPNIPMDEDGTYFINLDNYASDVDNLDSELSWSASGNVNIVVIIDSATHVAVISPKADWNGAETITFTVCDPAGLCDSDASTVTVNPINDAPVVGDVPGVTMSEDIPYTTLWSLNDYVSDIDNTDAEITWTYSGNANIGVAFGAGNVVTFTSAPDWNGAEVITFMGCDPSGLCDSDNSVVVVQPVNDAPVALDIPPITIIEDNVVSIDLDDYATDIDNTDAELSWTAIEGTHIRVFIDALSHIATIVPDRDWNGDETVTFTVCDPAGLCDSVAPLVSVVPQGDAPIISIIPPVLMYEDVPYTTIWSLDDYVTDIDTADADIDWTVSGNTNIDVAVDSATRKVTFTSTVLNWYGAEMITFTACDTTVPTPLCDSATTTVMVQPVNDAPVISNIPDVTIIENSFDNSIDLDNYITDVDGDPISWTYSGNTNIFVIIDANNVVTLVPLPDWNGFETITFTASDGIAPPVSDDSVVTVTSVNDAPVISNIPDPITMDEDTIDTSIDLDDYVTDVDNTDAQMTWTATGYNAANLVVTIDANHVVTLDPADNWFGIETITFTVCDPAPGSLCDSDTSTVWVVPVNDAPVISPVIPNQVKDEDSPPWSLDLSIYENDIEDGGMPEPDALRWWVSGVDTSLYTTSFDAAQNVITFTPVANANGVDTITLTLVDSDGLTDTQDITVTINPVNDDPIISDIPDFAIDEDTVFSVIDLDSFITDVDNDPIIWDVSGDINLNVVIDPVTHEVTITPDADWNGQETLTFTADDGTVTVSDDSTITVNPVNDAPVVGDIPDVTMSEDIPYTTAWSLDSYVTDVDIGDVISWSYSGNVNIAVSIDPLTHVVTLTPAADWNGAETITFTANDGNGGTDSDASLVTVTPMNDAPVAEAGPIQAVLTGTLVTLDGSGSYDIDAGDSISYSWSITTAPVGSVAALTNPTTVNPTFTPDVDGMYVISLTVTDLALATSTDSVVVFASLTPNNPPVATPNGPYTGAEGDAVSFDGTGSSDPDGDPIINYQWSFGDGSTDFGNNPTPTHAYADNGVYTVTLVVVDNRGMPSAPVTTTATISNVAPVVAGIPAVTFAEDGSTLLTGNPDLDFYVTDVAADTMTWTWTINPNVIVTNLGGNVVQFSAAADFSGTETITFTATDDDGSPSNPYNVVVTVTPVNDAPVVAGIPDETTNEDTPLTTAWSLDTYVTDIDNPDSDMVWSFSGNTNIGVSINAATRQVTFTPAPDWFGLEIITFQACDLGPLCDSDLMIVTVNPVNDNPVITTTCGTTATEDSSYSCDVDATDADGNSLTYSFNIPPPSGMTINALAGLIAWTPNNGQVGINNVIVLVSDGFGGTATQPFTITVANDPVSITSAPITTAMEGSLYTYDVQSDDEGQGLTAYSLTTLPAGMAINPATGVITWTPTLAQVGPNAVTVQVNDGNGAIVTQPFTITVTAVPVYGVSLTYPGDQSTTPGVSVTYTITITNTGNVPDSYTITTNNIDSADTMIPPTTPIGPLNPGVPTTLSLLTVGDTSVGTYRVSVTAVSITNPAATDSITTTTTVTIAADTTPPVISSIVPISGSTIAAVPFTLSANTNENANCKYSTVSTFDYATQGTVLTGALLAHSTSLNLANGVYTYYIKCQDASGNANTNANQGTTTFTVNIGAPNTAPTLTGLPDQSYLQNSGLHDNVMDLWAYASDAETPDNLLTFTIISQTNPAVANCVVDASGHFIDCTALNAAGISDVTVSVTDQGGLTAQDTFKVDVNTFAQSVQTAFALYDLSGSPVTTVAVGQDIYAVLTIDNMQSYTIPNAISTLTASGFSVLANSIGSSSNIITSTIPALGTTTVWWQLDTLAPAGSRTISVSTEGVVNSQQINVI